MPQPTSSRRIPTDAPPAGSDARATAISRCAASGDGTLLAVADDKGGVCLYNYPCCAPRAPCARAAGHSSHVTNVRWLLGDERCVSTGGHDRAIFQWECVRNEQAPPPLRLR